MAPRHWFTTQNFRVGTLQAAGDDSVPATNFGSRIKAESGGDFVRQKLDGPHSFHALSSRQPFQLCSRNHGKSSGWRRSRPHQQTYPGYPEYERSLRLLPLHVLSAAIHLREVSNLLERLGCHRHLRRADSMLRTHKRDLQNNRPRTDTSTNAAPLYHTDSHIRRHPN